MTAATKKNADMTIATTGSMAVCDITSSIGGPAEVHAGRMSASTHQQQQRRRQQVDHLALLTASSPTSAHGDEATTTTTLQQQGSMRELEEMMRVKLEIAELRTSLDDSQHIASQYRNENRRLRSKLTETTKECFALETRLSKYKSKMLQMKSLIDGLNRSQTEMRVRLEAAESQAAECRNTSRQLIQSNECLMNERDVLSSMVNENQQKAARLRSVTSSSHRRSTRKSFGLPFSRCSTPDPDTDITLSVPETPTVTERPTRTNNTAASANSGTSTHLRRGRLRSSRNESLEDDSGTSMLRGFSDISLSLDSISQGKPKSVSSSDDLTMPLTSLESDPTAISRSSTSLSSKQLTKLFDWSTAGEERSSYAQPAPNTGRNVRSSSCKLLEEQGSLRLEDIDEPVLLTPETNIIEVGHNTLRDVNSFFRRHSESDVKLYDEIDWKEPVPKGQVHPAPQQNSTEHNEQARQHESKNLLQRAPSIFEDVLDGLFQERVGEKTPSPKEDCPLSGGGGSYPLARQLRRNSLTAPIA